MICETANVSIPPQRIYIPEIMYRRESKEKKKKEKEKRKNKKRREEKRIPISAPIVEREN